MKIKCLIYLVWIPVMCAQAENTAEVIEFNKHIRPILSDRCFACHGPDPASREANLRFDREEDLRRALKLEDGILERVTTMDPDELMPPPKSKLKVTQEEISYLKRWIDQGAPFEKHWAFIAPERKSPPTLDDPWIRNDIDRFILKKLHESGLKPGGPATPERILRRLFFTLTGLPPTRSDLAEFKSDPSVEKVIDQLLASPAYGERMATEWLDVARYADSYGFQRDNNRHVWPWRDWVVRQFNANLPYDDFITWQLAGDLLPNPTEDQILATTFCRLHQQKVEGGSVPEEFRTEYVADRTHTFGTAFLGLTLECARCHDHKYDPISAKEYFQLFSYFNNIDEAGLYSYFHGAVPTPTYEMVSKSQRDKRDSIKVRIAELESELIKLKSTEKGAYDNWRESVGNELPIHGLIAHIPFDEEKIGKHANAVDDKVPANSSGRNSVVQGRQGKGIQLTGDDVISVSTGDFRRFQAFSVGLWIKTPDVKDRAVIFHRSKAWTDSAQQGYQMLIEDGKLSASVIHFWPGNAISIKSLEPIKPEEWQHILMSYDGSSRADGLGIFINGKKAEVETVRNNLNKSSRAGINHFSIGERMRDRGFTGGTVDDLRLYNRALTAAEIRYLFDGSVIDDLSSYYLHNLSDVYKQQLSALQAEYKALANLENAFTEIMVMKEMAQPRQTYVLARGMYDSPTVPVSAGTPEALLSFPDGAPNNRLGLSRWLTDPQHPLTARVAVNRYWQMHFGQGLVATSEDFGSQGSLPAHEELLDWLAIWFIDSGWDVKSLHKLIVSSATYLQDSRVLNQSDPDNVLLSRGPKVRLPAEMIRDQALKVSGLLGTRIGGAPVKPYDLTESFKPMGHDKGEGLYRRSLYTYWKLTGPSPVMMALDAVKRDVCTVKRTPTSSPLQALVLMNGPQFVEAARVMAEDLLAANPAAVDVLLRNLFEQITSLPPGPEELVVLEKLYGEQLAHFSSQPQLAEAYSSVGHKKAEIKDPVRVAALATVISAVMNLDQAVTLR